MVRKNTTYRTLLDELIEMSRIRGVLDLEEIPSPSTMCKAFNRPDMAVWRVLLNLSITLLPTNGGIGGTDALIAGLKSEFAVLFGFRVAGGLVVGGFAGRFTDENPSHTNWQFRVIGYTLLVSFAAVGLLGVLATWIINGQYTTGVLAGGWDGWHFQPVHERNPHRRRSQGTNQVVRPSAPIRAGRSDLMSTLVDPRSGTHD